MGSDIQEELKAIYAKLDLLLTAVEELRDVKRAKTGAKKSQKQKLPPLTEEEIKEHKKRFAFCFDQWMEGHELEVQTELEKLDAEQLRRFADANNLNVTSKMSAQKVLQLVGARFREKRQLHRSSLLRNGDRGQTNTQETNPPDDTGTPVNQQIHTPFKEE